MIKVKHIEYLFCVAALAGAVACTEDIYLDSNGSTKTTTYDSVDADIEPENLSDDDAEDTPTENSDNEGEAENNTPPEEGEGETENGFEGLTIPEQTQYDFPISSESIPVIKVGDPNPTSGCLLQLSADRLIFDNIRVGETASKTFYIKHVGDGVSCYLLWAMSSSNDISISPEIALPRAIYPGEKLDFTVRITPSELQDYNEKVSVMTSYASYLLMNVKVIAYVVP